MNTLTVTRLEHDDIRAKTLLKKEKLSCYDSWVYEWFGIEDGDTLCAVGAVRIANKTAYLYCGAVDENYRGQGLHGEVLNARIQYAKENNCRQAKVGVMGSNDKCKRSLSKAGFAPDSPDYNTSLSVYIETWRYDIE